MTFTGGEHHEVRSIRFKDCEYELFKKAAAKNKQEFSEWVRETLRQAIGI